MKQKRPRGWSKFDALMRKLVDVPKESIKTKTDPGNKKKK